MVRVGQGKDSREFGPPDVLRPRPGRSTWRYISGTNEKTTSYDYHARQCSPNFSRSLRDTPSGVADRFRVEGGGVGPGRPFLRPLDLPEGKAGEVGEVKPDFAMGLVGGDVAEGRS